MNVAGSTTQTNAMSPAEMHGLHRSKPQNTSLAGMVGSGVYRKSPVVTNLSAGKPKLQTQVTPQSMAAHVGTHKSVHTRHEQLVKQTQKWVAGAFYGTMLKQMRDDPFRSEMLDGGRGGQAFGTMYDQELAGRMSRGAGSKLVNTIVKHIENHENRSNQSPEQVQFKMQQAMRAQKSAVDPKQLQTQMPSEVR